MELYPAIDLRDGRCVRLQQGDYGQETIYGDDAVAGVHLLDAAEDFGPPPLHIVLGTDADRGDVPLRPDHMLHGRP